MWSGEASHGKVGCGVVRQGMVFETDFLTVKEFAALLKVNPETVRRGIRNKKIIALKPAGGKKSGYRIPRSEIERLALREMYLEEKND